MEQNLLDANQDILGTLEGLLVKEFRAYQALYSLTRQERFALWNADTSRLLDLADYKQAVLDRITSFSEARRTALPDAISSLEKLDDFSPFEGEFPSADEQGSWDCLARILEGINLLVDRIRYLTRGNYALAFLALERASELQAHLVEGLQVSAAPDVDQEDRSYIALNKVSKGDGGTSESHAAATLPAGDYRGEPIDWSVVAGTLGAARQAIKAEDQVAISRAVGELQDIIERLVRFLDRDDGVSRRALDSIDFTQRVSLPPYKPFTVKEEYLVEALAGLYHQEIAYQAVLKVNNRILIGA